MLAIVLVILALVAGVMTVVRIRSGKGAVIFAVSAAVLLLGGVLLLVSARTQPTSAASPGVVASGISAPVNYHMISVLAPSGQEMLLNAQNYPVLFVSQNDSIKSIATAYAAIHKAKRPLILVATYFHTANAKAAAKEVTAYLAGQAPGFPWALQTGPAAEYVQSTPTLVYYDRAGRLHTATGSAILSDLKAAVLLPSNPAATRTGGTKK